MQGDLPVGGGEVGANRDRILPEGVRPGKIDLLGGLAAAKYVETKHGDSAGAIGTRRAYYRPPRPVRNRLPLDLPPPSAGAGSAGRPASRILRFRWSLLVLVF